MNKIEYNNSVFCLLPLTQFPKEHFKKVINTFIYHESYLKNKYLLYILFDNTAEDSFNMRYKCCSLPNYYGAIDAYKDYGLLIFGLLDYKEYVDDFVKGKYSKFSKEHKEAISSYFNMRKLNKETKAYEPTGVAKLIYPTKELREQLGDNLGVKLDEDAEIHGKPNVDKETYRLNYVIKLIENNG